MHVAQGKYEEVFQLLEKHLGAEDQQVDIPQLRGRYSDWLKQQKEGIMDSRDLLTEQNRIRYAVLTYANQIKTPD